MSKQANNDLIHDLEDARQNLLLAVAPFTSHAWDAPIHTSGDRWTLLQLMRHLLDMHYFQRQQMEAFISGKTTVGADFDLDAFNAEGQKRLCYLSAPDVLDGLNASHQRLLATVHDLTTDQLNQTLFHFAMRKQIALHEYIGLMAFHERLHTDDIRQASVRYVVPHQPFLRYYR